MLVATFWKLDVDVRVEDGIDPYTLLAALTPSAGVTVQGVQLRQLPVSLLPYIHSIGCDYRGQAWVEFGRDGDLIDYWTEDGVTYRPGRHPLPSDPFDGLDIDFHSWGPLPLIYHCEFDGANTLVTVPREGGGWARVWVYPNGDTEVCDIFDSV